LPRGCKLDNINKGAIMRNDRNDIQRPSDDLGKLILRAGLAILMLFHGISKVINGVDPIVGMVTSAGLPGAFGYLVYVGEIIAPLLVLIGIMTRPAALVMAVNMIVAVGLAHMKDLMTLSKTGGWALELQGLYLVAAIAVVLLGAGRYSAAGIHGRWN
jgi:putative oxidoreductase